METLIVLGTGNASAVHCYNTCFALTNGADYFLVDGGGGNGILGRIDQAGIPWAGIRHAFATHSHTDHIFGMVWVIRAIATLMGRGDYKGTFTIHCHEELAGTLRTIARLTLTPGMTRFLDKEIEIRAVQDGETARILDYDATFFDIRSTKQKQFGFTLRLHNGKKLCFLGDEPYNERCESYVKDSAWLLSEAFCLHSQRDVFKPYEKHHGTAREACALAARFGVENLVLWHTEDHNLALRKELYTAEGREVYAGRLLVPNDLDRIVL